MTVSPLRLGVSACLLGEEVRYNGGHKRDRFVTDVLGPFVEWVPVCPEVEAGLGIPRPTVRLVGLADAPRVLTTKGGEDHTAALHRATRERLKGLADQDLCGFVLKKGSPSCGVFRVKVYTDAGMPGPSGRGVFAAALLERFPDLPVEEEGRLNDPVLRENFVERIFAYRRVKDLFRNGWRMGDLVAFHTREKLFLRAHDETAYRRMGRLVAKGRASKALEKEYRGEFMCALFHVATRRRHTNVLQHMAGYFKRDASSDERQELAAVIEDYRQGLLPLIVPLTLIRHFVTRWNVEYLAGQSYLSPHPKEMMLRNHV